MNNNEFMVTNSPVRIPKKENSLIKKTKPVALSSFSIDEIDTKIIDISPPVVPPRPVRRKADMVVQKDTMDLERKFTKLEDLTLENILYLLTHQYNDKINENTVRKVKNNVKNGMSLSRCIDVDEIIDYVQIDKEDAILLLNIINSWKNNYILTSSLEESPHHSPLLVPKKKTKSVTPNYSSSLTSQLANSPPIISKSPPVRRRHKEEIKTVVAEKLSLEEISKDAIDLEVKDVIEETKRIATLVPTPQSIVTNSTKNATESVKDTSESTKDISDSTHKDTSKDNNKDLNTSKKNQQIRHEEENDKEFVIDEKSVTVKPRRNTVILDATYEFLDIDIYENERYQSGWSSSNLRYSDPKRYISKYNHDICYKTLPIKAIDVQYLVPEDYWIFHNDELWELTKEEHDITDSKGWVYGESFETIKNNPITVLPSVKVQVRRRLWNRPVFPINPSIRYNSLEIEEDLILSNPNSPSRSRNNRIKTYLDDDELDDDIKPSVVFESPAQGILFSIQSRRPKLHRRKYNNWKSQYIELYNDGTMIYKSHKDGKVKGRLDIRCTEILNIDYNEILDNVNKTSQVIRQLAGHEYRTISISFRRINTPIEQYHTDSSGEEETNDVRITITDEQCIQLLHAMLLLVEGKRSNVQEFLASNFPAVSPGGLSIEFDTGSEILAEPLKDIINILNLNEKMIRKRVENNSFEYTSLSMCCRSNFIRDIKHLSKKGLVNGCNCMILLSIILICLPAYILTISYDVTYTYSLVMLSISGLLLMTSGFTLIRHFDDYSAPYPPLCTKFPMVDTNLKLAIFLFILCLVLLSGANLVLYFQSFYRLEFFILFLVCSLSFITIILVVFNNYINNKDDLGSIYSFINNGVKLYSYISSGGVVDSKHQIEDAFKETRKIFKIDNIWLNTAWYALYASVFSTIICLNLNFDWYDVQYEKHKVVDREFFFISQDRIFQSSLLYCSLMIFVCLYFIIGSYYYIEHVIEVENINDHNVNLDDDDDDDFDERAIHNANYKAIDNDLKDMKSILMTTPESKNTSFIKDNHLQKELYHILQDDKVTSIGAKISLLRSSYDLDEV